MCFLVMLRRHRLCCCTQLCCCVQCYQPHNILSVDLIFCIIVILVANYRFVPSCFGANSNSSLKLAGYGLANCVLPQTGLVFLFPSVRSSVASFYRSQTRNTRGWRCKYVVFGFYWLICCSFRCRKLSNWIGLVVVVLNDDILFSMLSSLCYVCSLICITYFCLEKY